MDADRRFLSAIVAIAMFAAIWSSDRWAESLEAVLIIPTAVAGTVALLLLLGPERGGILALVVTAALNGYVAEVIGVSVKPEHLAAPVVAVVLLPQVRRLVGRVNLAGWLILAWIGWSVVGAVNAPDSVDSLQLWVMLALVAFPFFVILTTTTTEGRLQFILDAWLLVGIGVGIFGLLLHLFFAWGIDLGIQINPATNDPTVPATFREANLFGSAMMMLGLTPIALWAFGSRPRPLTWTAALVGILAVQVSFTRTAWIAFVAGLVILAILKVVSIYGRSDRVAPVTLPARQTTALVLAALLGTAAIWAPIGDPDVSNARDQAAQEQATTRADWGATQTAAAREATPVPTVAALSEGEEPTVEVPTPVPENPDIVGRVGSITDPADSSVQIRIEFAERAVEDWQDHPVAGQGIGSFGQKYTTSSFTRAWLSNILVRVLHDGGVVGLLLFLTPLVVMAVQTLGVARKPSHSQTDRIALAVGVAVAGMFVAFMATEGFQLAWYWCSFGLFAAALRLSREPDSESSRV